MDNIIYGLADPFTNEIRYVGKSTTGMKRPREHFKPFNLKKNTRVYNWINSIILKNSIPEIVTLYVGFSKDCLYEAERQIIAAHPNLTNLTEGGEGTHGYRHKPETIIKLSTIRKARPKDPKFIPHNKIPIVDCGNGVAGKVCTKCNILKPLNNYHNRKKKPDAWCAFCRAEYQRNWQKAHPRKKLSPEEWKLSYVNRQHKSK